MPRPSKAAKFVQMFDAVDAPWYALDERRQIAYLNGACAELLGVAPNELVGKVCHYRSGNADPLGQIADGLCPPPEVFSGQSNRGEILLMNSGGVPERRGARFTTLSNLDGTAAGVLVSIAELGESGEGLVGNPINPLPESHHLHVAIAQMRAELKARHSLDRLIGVSPAMQRVRAQVEIAAGCRSTVLIVGPAGIGKQQVARTIHYAASKGDATLAPVSCESLPAELLLSNVEALVLRQKSAGAQPNATLLLSDVQSLPIEVQREVLRLLMSAPPNVRVIATSTVAVDALIEGQKFNRDLALHLSTLVIELPPLSDRRDDIPLIAQLLLEDCNAARPGKQLRGLAPEVIDRLMSIDWPRQIDELAATIQAAFDAAEGFEISLSDLPKRVRLAAEAIRYQRKATEPIQLERFMAEIEAELIDRALKQAKGNKTTAAKLLGLTRPRLYRRIVQLGLAAASPPNRAKTKRRTELKPTPPKPLPSALPVEESEALPLTLDDDWGELDWEESDTE